jgi:hypothetical protein
MRLRARIKHSHIYTHQANVESTSNSARGIPASQAGYQYVHKEGIRVPHALLHATGASRLHHQLIFSGLFRGSQLPAPPVGVQRPFSGLTATGVYPSSLHHQLVFGRSFSGPTAAGVCPCDDSKKNSGVSAQVSRTIRHTTRLTNNSEFKEVLFIGL